VALNPNQSSAINLYTFDSDEKTSLRLASLSCGELHRDLARVDIQNLSKISRSLASRPRNVNINVNVNLSICIARITGKPPNSLGALVPCEQKVFIRRLKAASVVFGLRTGSGRLFQADGPAVTGRRPYVLSRLCGTCSRFRSAERALSLVGQWDAVNGEVLRCPTAITKYYVEVLCFRISGAYFFQMNCLILTRWCITMFYILWYTGSSLVLANFSKHYWLFLTFYSAHVQDGPQSKQLTI